MTHERDREGQEIREMFLSADQTLSGPTPFMRTRILAHLREAKADRRIRIWKRLAMASPVVSALVLILVFWNVSAPAFRATVNEKVLVNVSVEELEASQIAFAEVELPDDVFFYSEKYPELATQREIRLAWHQVKAMGSLPVVIQSSVTGVKQVKVRFLDHERNLVKEREIAIQFDAFVKHGGIVVSQRDQLQERKFCYEV